MWKDTFSFAQPSAPFSMVAAGGDWQSDLKLR